MEKSGAGLCQITTNGPADGPEFAGDWIFYNTEAFSGHAQIARIPKGGGRPERLSHGPSVDWFPHVAPKGEAVVYLSFPPGTRGHPADLPVELKLVTGDWRWLQCATGE